MAKASKATADQHEEGPGFAGDYAQADGYTIGFETYSEDTDPAELFKGLPNDRCQSPHWGFVLKGRLIYRYGDGTEDVLEAGDAYYIPPNHLPVMTAGTEVVEFSPTADFAKTIEQVTKNIDALQSSS